MELIAAPLLEGNHCPPLRRRLVELAGKTQNVAERQMSGGNKLADLHCLRLAYSLACHQLGIGQGAATGQQASARGLEWNLGHDVIGRAGFRRGAERRLGFFGLAEVDEALGKAGRGRREVTLFTGGRWPRLMPWVRRRTYGGDYGSAA